MPGELPRSPNVFHPTKPSAVGSRNSLAQEGRNQEEEYKRLIEEETEKVLKELQIKLPKEVLERLDIMGGIKQKLYNYFNQNYQNMFNRYLTTAEDEMVKKIRNFIDKEELKELFKIVKNLKDAIRELFNADMFNYASLGNIIRHVHVHFIPRYSKKVKFRGIILKIKDGDKTILHTIGILKFLKKYFWRLETK